MFCTDRDLLALEPNLFRDGGWVAQRLVYGTAAIAGTTLTVSSPDVEFDDAGIGEGHIALVDGTPYEVIERLSATTLTVSRLRASTSDDPIPPTPVSSKPLTIHTFNPQIAIVHRQLLAMLGLGASGSGEDLTENEVTNPGDLTHLEALGALHLVFAVLAGPGGGNWADRGFSRMHLYQERFAAERSRALAYLDTDGDGLPDAARRFNAFLTR